MGLLGAEILGLGMPGIDRRLLVISETDGCFVDGLGAATGCRAGNRSLRILDFGKVAATFVDTCTEETIRILPKSEARLTAAFYAPGARNKWESMLYGYQTMPASDLFVVQHVQLNDPLSKIIGSPGIKARCEVCGEEILNGREILKAGTTLCRACSGEGYFKAQAEELSLLLDQ